MGSRRGSIGACRDVLGLGSKYSISWYLGFGGVVVQVIWEVLYTHYNRSPYEVLIPILVLHNRPSGGMEFLVGAEGVCSGPVRDVPLRRLARPHPNHALGFRGLGIRVWC